MAVPRPLLAGTPVKTGCAIRRSRLKPLFFGGFRSGRIGTGNSCKSENDDHVRLSGAALAQGQANFCATIPQDVLAEPCCFSQKRQEADAYAHRHHRACVVYVLEPVQYCEKTGARADVRRIESSLSFQQQFGMPTEQVATLNHSLGRVLPIGRKMTRPTTISITDRNGHAHECIAEAFDTTFNVLILVYPIKALTITTIVF
jgi:hypothetical protein